MDPKHKMSKPHHEGGENVIIRLGPVTGSAHLRNARVGLGVRVGPTTS